MTGNADSELGNTQALTSMIDSMRKGRLEVTHNGDRLEMGRKLGEGGTKTVYEAVIGGNPFALAFPNTVDGVDRMTQKWKIALQEPANTQKVRTMGLIANPVYEALPVDINGVPFTSFKMARYQDLPFQIMDGKNSRSSTISGDILPEELNDVTYEEYFSSTLPDMWTLIQNGVRIGTDSINICIVDGRPRIYLSDLGNAEFEPFSTDAIPHVAERYVMNAKSAFLNGLTESEYQKHEAFFDGKAFSFTNPNNMTHRLSERLIKGLK